MACIGKESLRPYRPFKTLDQDGVVAASPAGNRPIVGVFYFRGHGMVYQLSSAGGAMIAVVVGMNV